MSSNGDGTWMQDEWLPNANKKYVLWMLLATMTLMIVKVDADDHYGYNDKIE